MNTTPISHTRRFGLRLFSQARALLTVSVLAALAVTTDASAQVLLPPGPPYLTVSPSKSTSAAIGDMNGDGNKDVVLSVWAFNGTVQVALGDGQGGFAAPRTFTSDTAPTLAGNVVLGDLNGDGKLDVVVVNDTGNQGAQTFSVLFGDGAGNLSIPTVYNLWTDTLHGPPGIGALRLGDVDGDGKLDIIVSTNGNQPTGFINSQPFTTSRVMVLRNNGAGVFTIPTTAVWTAPGFRAQSMAGDLAVADMDGDGKLDIVVISSFGDFDGNDPRRIYNVLYGDGTGAFPTTTGGRFPRNAPDSPFATCYNAQNVAVADVNGDGKPDVVVTSVDFWLSGGGVAVFPNMGSRTFDAGYAFRNPYRASAVVSADLNNDGSPDLLVCGGADGGDLSYFLNDGHGVFADAVMIPASPAVAMAAGDLTNSGSGTSDIVIATLGARGTQLLKNGPAGPATPPAQLFFTDALNGPNSSNLAAFPAGKYSYTTNGVRRSQSSSDSDRPVIATSLKTYLASTTGNFGADISVNIANNDIAYFGLGQGDADPYYNSEPSHAYYFRAHNNFVNGGGGYYGIQAAVKTTNPSPNWLANQDIASYSPGTTITLRITRIGDKITMSVVGGSSVTYSLSAYQAALGLTNANTAIFFGNTSVGTTFSNLKVYPLPNDVTPPVIAVPADIVAEATSPAGAPVTFTATATDDVDGNVNVVASPASGSTFPIATTPVGLAASDKAGNTATASFNVTVQDKTPPSIGAVPVVAPVEATSPNGAVVTFTVPTATDIVDGTDTVIATPASGSTFAPGNTTVTLKSTDAHGNFSSKTFTVTVVDTTAPVITVPTVAAVEATSALGAVVTYPAATATDAVGVTSLTYSKASGTTFPIGTTTVTVTAKDAAGNPSTKSFTVTVKDSTAPAITATMTAKGGGDDESTQFFTIAFSATDLVGVKTLTAVLNGITVTNGQIVQLQLAKSGKQESEKDDGKLKIKATAFSLVVTAADAVPNTSTKTVVPVFVKNGKDSEDKKSDDKSSSDDKSGKKDS